MTLVYLHPAINLILKNLVLIVFLLFGINVCNAQNLDILIDEGNFQIDYFNKIIISQISNINNYSDLSIYQNLTINFSSIEFVFQNVPPNLSFKDEYQVVNNNELFTLYFTQLPIVTLDTINTIVDEPKVLAKFTYSDDEQTFSSFIGVEYRGGFSQTYPKKNYDIELWENEIGEETTKHKFGNLRKDDDWILDALYNEPLRIRSYIAHKLWLNMHQLYYSEEEQDAKSGADVMFVEMFLNEKYNGIYLLSEQVDRKQLQIKSFKNDEIRGELFKGITFAASNFNNLSPFDNNSRIWGGFEQKYPKENEKTEWQNLYNLGSFILDGNCINFESNIWQNFQYENSLDYFIFLNVLRATDNTGKNTYLAKYNVNEPYFYVPWDLDGCFGTIWNGEKDTTTQDILSNTLYNRTNLCETLDKQCIFTNRYNSLRNNILSNQNLENQILNAYNYLTDNNIYSRERKIYNNYSFDSESKTYIINWLSKRLAFLDYYFENVQVTDSIQLPTSIFPIPAKHFIRIKNFETLKQTDYHIFNLNGQLNSQGKLSCNQISISHLDAGVYFLKLNDNLHKLIVE